jgi:hypothetical protein
VQRRRVGMAYHREKQLQRSGLGIWLITERGRFNVRVRNFLSENQPLGMAYSGVRFQIHNSALPPVPLPQSEYVQVAEPGAVAGALLAVESSAFLTILNSWTRTIAAMRHRPKWSRSRGSAIRVLAVLFQCILVAQHNILHL